MRGPRLAPCLTGRWKKGMRRRARRRRRGRGGGRSTAGSRVWTPSRTPSLSRGGCRASSPASPGRSRTCRRWPAAPGAARTCWPSRRTPSTSGAGSSAAAPSGGSPPRPLPRCRLSWRRPSRPSTSETTVSSTAVAPAPAVADRSTMIYTEGIDRFVGDVCIRGKILMEIREETDKTRWMGGSYVIVQGSHRSSHRQSPYTT